MFDDIKNNPTPSAGPRQSGPTPRPVIQAKAEDIFDEVDKTVKPEVFQTNPDNPEPPRGTVLPAATGWKSNKLMVFGLLFGGLVIVIAGGYFGLRLAIKSEPVVDNTEIQDQPVNNEFNEETPLPTVEPVNTVVEPTVQPVVAEPLDSDHDGLTDEEEISLGANPSNPDTDGDGLNDREEANVFKTDPLNADTDGDGYQDGAEVNGGYNPKGPGKLLEINK